MGDTRPAVAAGIDAWEADAVHRRAKWIAAFGALYGADPFDVTAERDRARHARAAAKTATGRLNAADRKAAAAELRQLRRQRRDELAAFLTPARDAKADQLRDAKRAKAGNTDQIALDLIHLTATVAALG